MSDLVKLLRSRNCIGQLHNLEGLEAADRIEFLEAEVERLQARERELIEALAWRHRRFNTLQAAQRHMRDPERRVVCDILATGTTYIEPYSAALAALNAEKEGT